ncbi:MAG: type II secretion system protein GspG [Pseudomonadota bacterium]
MTLSPSDSAEPGQRPPDTAARASPCAGPCPHLRTAPEVARCAACGCALCAACAQRHAGRTLCAACRAAPAADAHQRPGGQPAITLLLLGVLALLSSAGVAWLLAWSGTVHQARADRETLDRLRFSLDDFYLDTSRYPTPTEGFTALVTPDPELDGDPILAWHGPYLDLDRLDLRWSSRRGGLQDRRGDPVLYYASPSGDWVYLAETGPNRQLDTPGLGGPDFAGLPLGDDVVVWVEGP